MTFDFMLYKKLVAEDRKLTQQMVDNGELTDEDGWFRDLMREDEIFEQIED